MLRNTFQTCMAVRIVPLKQVLMFYHLKTRRCVNTVLLQAS